MTGEGDAARDSASYAYKPSLLGAGWEFRLTGDGISWSTGARSGYMPFAKVRRVRMAYRPTSMQSHRFMTELWADGAPKLTVISSTWKSLVEQGRQDKEYAAFVGELHRRLMAAGATPRCEQGSHPVLYWPGLVAVAGIALGMAWLIVRALQSDAKGGALFIAVFLGLFLWHGGNFLRRNRPGRYRPEAPPRELLPG